MIGKVCEVGRSGPGARTIERMLPRDHLLRRVDRLLDLSELRSTLAQHYSPRGRPSVDPELLLRMALIGRIYAIPSERRLCEELRYNLAYRWLCRLPAGAAVPHHSTFSKNRHGRFRDAGVFRLLFENTVRRCIAAGLVSTKDAAIDASFVGADASWQRKMREGDLAGAALLRPVRDWLADQDAASEVPANPRRSAPAELSRTDPAAAWSSRTVRGRFGYALNVLIDTPSGVTLDVEASPARFAAEVDAGRDMLARTAERFGYRPKRVAADTAYGSAAFLAFMRDRGAIPHIPVMERSEQAKGKFPRAGCRRTFEEKVSGVKRDRPELARLLDQVRDDDVVMVTRLDRLARSTKDLLDIAEKLNEAGAGLRSLAEPWADTTFPAGRMVLTVFAGIAEFERAGLPADKQRPGCRQGSRCAFRPPPKTLSRSDRARRAPGWRGDVRPRGGQAAQMPSCDLLSGAGKSYDVRRRKW